jgi:hypothetical protein
MVKNGITKPWCKKTRQQTIDLRQQGFSRAEITQMTGVSRTCQIQFQKMHVSSQALEPKKRDQSGTNNPNTKMDQKYLDLMKLTVVEHSDWSHDQIRVHINKTTGKDIPYSTFCDWMRKLPASRKLYSTEYYEATAY